MSKIENFNLSMLAHELRGGRPELVERGTSFLTGELIRFEKQVMADGTTYDAEAEINKWVKKNFHRSVWSYATVFCRQFLIDFYKDRSLVIPDIVERIAKAPWRVSEAYLIFFQHLITTAAAIGYPSIQEPFSKDRKKLIKKITKRSEFSIFNVTALRIYLADILCQVSSARMSEFESLINRIQPIETIIANKSWTEYARIINKIPALFGSQPNVKEGKVDSQAEYTLDDSGQRYEYSRESDTIYFPDLQAAEALVAIGKLFGRNADIDPATGERQYYDRLQTYELIGTMSQTDALKIFPDLFHHEINVKSNHKIFIEMGFGLPYELVRGVFETEFTNEWRGESGLGFLQRMRNIGG